MKAKKKSATKALKMSICTRCLKATPLEEYLECDHQCMDCFDRMDYPLEATP